MYGRATVLGMTIIVGRQQVADRGIALNPHVTTALLA
jgi:hypothetical protein